MRGLAAFCALVAASCGGGALRRFPLREPMWRDTDLESRSVPCRAGVRAGEHVCRPREYVSSTAWDAADNLGLRPLVRFFAVDPGGEAVNVNSHDEVPDSSWFENRIGRRPMSPEEVARGACGDDLLDTDGPDGSWRIDMGKPNGANPGFRIRLPDGTRYMLKSDLAVQPERTTGAAAIAGRLYHAAGFHVPCERVIYIRPSILTLTPGLVVTDNLLVTRPFDREALGALLAQASRRGDHVRFVASRWLPGRTLGPFTYDGIKADDPGDVFPHEDRRDLRGARLLAAWTGHYDSREQNSMVTWLADDPAAPDSSPGQVRHYYIDLGDCFGSASVDELWPRIGHAYFLDFGYLLADFATLGLIERPWDRAQLQRGGRFGYYSTRDFDPEAWRGQYQNPAFVRMTERDGAWAARVLARFDDAHLAAAVSVGDFTDSEDAAFLVRELAGRRDAILRRYFALVSPVADLAVVGDELCGVDLARRSGLFPAGRFAYRARVRGVGAEAPVRATAGGRVCATLPHRPGATGADSDPSRYVVVDLTNGQAPGELHAHLYDMGPGRGFRLAGIER